MAFEPINTQEEFDKAIKARIEQAQESERAKYEGWISPEDLEGKLAQQKSELTSITEQLTSAKSKIDEQTTLINDKDARIKSLEANDTKMKVAHQMGLDYSAVEFLKGDDEESIKASAEALKSIVGYVPPLADPPGGKPKGTDAAYKGMLMNMKGE